MLSSYFEAASETNERLPHLNHALDGAATDTAESDDEVTSQAAVAAAISENQLSPESILVDEAGGSTNGPELPSPRTNRTIESIDPGATTPGPIAVSTRVTINVRSEPQQSAADSRVAPADPVENQAPSPDASGDSGAGEPPFPPDGYAEMEEGDNQPEDGEHDFVNTLIPTQKGLEAAGIADFEKKLSQEGMPEELPDNPVFTLDIAARYEQAADALRQENQTEPTSDEVAEYLASRQVREDIVAAAREHGTRVEVPETLAEPQSLEEQVIDGYISEELYNMLDKLHESSPREAMVIKARFGLDYDRPVAPPGDEGLEEVIAKSYGNSLSYHQIGRMVGVSGPTARQMESNALKMLREAGFSGRLGDYVIDTEDTTRWDPPETIYHTPNLTSPIAHLPGGDVPLSDAATQKPYQLRVAEVAKRAAQTWSKENIDSLARFHDAPRVSEGLRAVAATTKPVGYYHDGYYYNADELPANAPDAQAVYDLDQLRVTELTAIKTNIARELEPLQMLRHRVELKPARPESRQAALIILDHRISALEKYQVWLDAYLGIHTDKIQKGRSTRSVL
ncbi:MAG TPA: sigma factor-like helix-turn-helix DNA-binding protein [Candidatus Saccharimonadales bacterium]|nr:sigma factor-like helix-turn-helix DNA-binding protein [Candidatus Saccharimonadales bacterium]